MLTFEAHEEDDDSDQEDVGRTLFKAAEQEVIQNDPGTNGGDLLKIHLWYSR